MSGVDGAQGRWGDREPLYHAIMRLLDRGVRAWLDLRVAGADHIPRDGPVLLAANHVSFLDPVVLATVCYRQGRKVRFLTLSDLFQRPVVGWALRAGRMIPVVRGGGPERMVHAACDALDAGQAVLVYPEGRITPGRRVPAQPGAGLLALRTTSPVVPLCSYGLASPPGRRIPPLRQRAAVTVGPPVDLSAWRGRRDREAQLAAAEAMLDAVYDLLPVTRRTAGAAG